jgi:hypothetical protein
MKICQHQWIEQGGWDSDLPKDSKAQLVLLFGGARALNTTRHQIQAAFPGAHVFGCTTAGEICDTRVSDDTLVATGVEFDTSWVAGTLVRKNGGTDNDLGKSLARSLDPETLRHVLVLSDGIHVNGSDLVRGLVDNLPAGVTVTGGLSGDGARFSETLVISDGDPQSKAVAAVGLYGEKLSVGYGSLGGWDQFGPERLITKSEGNVLFEMDGRSALELYKTYLGEHAAGLPGSGLLFPLALRMAEGDTPVVRTILAVDEEKNSMTFAGDVPEGAYARLMKANFDRLIDGATGAAQTSHQALGCSAELAILISCVGRKMVLGQRIEEEVEAVRDVLGERAVLTGFYSYGEISPFAPAARCELHNQTMTITTIAEG